MRIALDGSALRPHRTGVGYYTDHLLRHLADAIAPDDELIVVSNRPVETTGPLPARVRVLEEGSRVPRMVWMQTRAAAMLARIGADVAHFTNGMMPVVSGVPSIVTIHDMSLRLLPRYHPVRRVLLNRPLMDLAARRARAIITVSESAKRDIVRLYALDPARVHVVYEAAAPQFHRVVDPDALERVRVKYGLARRIILYVGTIEPRKNLSALIRAFAKRRRSGDLDHQLVCVGPYGWLSRGIDTLIADAKIADAIAFTGYVPFEDLPALYSAAEIFVYPSMYEGFGLPVVEAMACGTPVVTGPADAVAEVGAFAVEQVDAIDVDALGDALVRLACDPERRQMLADAGLARADQFSWARAARQSLDVYREAVAARRVTVTAARARRSELAAADDSRVSVPAAWSAAPSTSVAASAIGSAVVSSGSSLAVDAAPTSLTSTRPIAPAVSRSRSSRVDVLFGQAYFLRFDPKLWRAQQPYAPLGALYAAAIAREHGYQVALFDAMLADSEVEWAAALDRHAPRVAVIYEDSFNYLSKMCLLRMRQAALTMIAAARTRGIPTIVSGSDASDHPATYLVAGAEVVIAGEGEMTLVEVLDALSARRLAAGNPPLHGSLRLASYGGPGEAQAAEAGEQPASRHSLDSIAGVCCHDAAGRLVRTKAREIIRDLDALPFPAWDLVDVERYRSIWRARHGYFSMNVATTRGCPYHCNWCAKPIYGQRYTARSPENVVNEMAWLKRTFDPDHLWIADDIFGLKPGWIERFASLVAERGAAVPFKCLLRADQVTPEIAGALRRSRCKTAWIGAESGSQRVLDAMEKGTRVDQIERATALLHCAGIEVGFFLQFGYPGETREDIDQTLEMVRACRPDDIGVSVSYPLPGTTFYQRVREQLGWKQNWVDSSDLAMMYQATYVPDFYRALHATVHAEFRARRSADEITRVLSHPLRARPRHARAMLQFVAQRAMLPILRHRVDRLGRVAPSKPAVRPLAVLSPQAASIPSEQPRWRK